MNQANRLEQVWSALGEVTDPEIDESVTTLKFVTGVEIEGDSRIRIKFRLPTYWCAPNFAFLMASDMRDAVAQLPWVEDVSVELLDHFSANVINRSVARKQDFRDAFPGETDGDLNQLRQTFLGKSYQRRQELFCFETRFSMPALYSRTVIGHQAAKACDRFSFFAGASA